ncbi:MAG: sigma-70 family RNA polymerase sigma factor [Rhodothermaceae bacterium]|nr:sigma-70 family RNA polymerase sigma factor [Gemmatimonadota bacterium]MYA10164.1 sigma-70 family RNA polymerase sigma factor [Gemmatimonadota bacterium]MYD20283.1 sigma-70 family RNA polymerase sigma factor [Rhodothermaceae bacterium]
MNRNGGRSTRGDGRRRDDDLLQRVEPLVVSVAMRFARDRTTAEELAQACRIRIHEKRRQCRDPKALLGWAKTLCRRVCADAVGRDRIEGDRFVEIDGDVTPAVDAAPDPLAAAETAELRVRIGSALARLPDEQRRLLLLRYWPGLSANEIAHREGLPASTVRNKLRRACLRLRRTPELACYAPRRPSLWSQGPGNGIFNGSNIGTPPALGEAAP